MTHAPGTRNRSRRKRRRWLRLALWAGVVLVVAGLGLAVGMVAGALKTLPSVTSNKPRPRATSVVYDVYRQPITKIYNVENREPIPIDEVPVYVQNAFVAVEDERFWKHRGVDPIGIARALYNDIRGRRWAEGASTITQQLARNSFPIGRERTLRRKVQEAILALELERRFTKKEILEMYLNQIYFGRDAYGIEAAAQTYFGKKARDLTLAEGALLAGLPQAPNAYEPIDHPDKARERRDVVLDLMVQNGFITAEEAAAAQKEPVKTVGPRKYADYKAPHFVDYVLALLLERFPADQVYQGGLKVYTTLDPAIQEAAEAAVKKHLAKHPVRPGQDYPEAAVVVLDQETGYIKAMVGGRTHSKVLELNRAWYNPRARCCARQPGSAFKPLAVYLPALEKGYTAASVFDDSPKSYPGTGGKEWTPKNFDNKYSGPITIREAVRRSVNTVAVQVLDRIGIETGYRSAERLGITTLVPSGPVNDRNLAMALGGLTRGASVLDMARAYAAIANGGYRVEPIAILRVEDVNGNVLLENRPRRTKVIQRSEVAYLLLDILRSGVEGPQSGWVNPMSTAWRARVPAIDSRGKQVGYWPTAGKTGTTSDNKDIWFVGFTPRYTAAVWIGKDNPSRAGSLPRDMLSSWQPAWIFRDTMAKALAGQPPLPFPRPKNLVTGVKISARTGLLAVAATPPEWVRSEVFLPGTEPKEYDPGWIKVKVCQDRPDLLYDASCGCKPEDRYFPQTPGSAAPGDAATDAGTAPQPWWERLGPPPSRSCTGQETDVLQGAGGGYSAAPAPPPSPPDESRPAAPVTFHITARQGALEPHQLRFRAGERVRLAITAEVDHTLQAPELGLQWQVWGGTTAEVEFTVSTPGVYQIRCASHAGEMLRLIVEP